MKICIIRHAYFPDDPRDRKQVFALLEAGFSVDVICLRKKGQDRRENVRGAAVLRIPLVHKRAGILRYFIEYALSFIIMTFILLYQFAKKRYDCVQVSTMPDFLVFSTVIPKLLGAKVLIDLHEPTPELWITKHGPNGLRWLLYIQTRIEQMAIKYADHCLTVTEALRRCFGERGANIEKITVIPNVCEEETFCDDSSFKEPASDNGFRLITHGLIEERYGHEVVIRAVAKLRERLPNLRFEILGDGEYKPVVARTVEEFACQDRVYLLGFVPIDVLLQRLRAAHVGVVAMQRSPYSELVDTNKMYEYIALRKPIIISRLPGVEDTFDESCVMFFKPGNQKDLARCIVELYQNPKKRSELAENAYRRYEKIRWRETKKIYVRVFEDLVAEGTG